VVVADFALESHHLKILEAAAGAWDRAEQARRLVDAEGLTVKDRFGQAKPHPATLIERDNRALFARLVRELGLDVEAPGDSRPPRLGGQRF
jgi:phage terminase small subunit